MAFRLLKVNKYPPRLWCLTGYPGSGKSTFALQMSEPLLVIDADHRFDEVVRQLNQSNQSKQIFQLSDVPSDSNDTNRIAQLLAEGMPGATIKTIVIDSLTAVITPLVVQAITDKLAGRVKNLSAAFMSKAIAVRQLQDAVGRWGTDVIYIYHLMDARDSHGNHIVKSSISDLEINRLLRSINMKLQIVSSNDGRRGIKVVWARHGLSGMTIWDDTNAWIGMPDKIEQACYDGFVAKADSPTVFPSVSAAIAWAVEQGVFVDSSEAQAVYKQIKAQSRPKNAEEMAQLWVAEVNSRRAKVEDR